MDFSAGFRSLLMAFCRGSTIEGGKGMGNRVFEVFLYTIAILFILAIVIIFFGMAFFCVLRGRSSVSGKILWFVFFFFTGPLGSTFYYFAVYRRLVRTQYEVEHA